MRGSMPPKCDAREVKKILERSGFENKDLVYDDGWTIVATGHLGLKAESIWSMGRHLAPYGLEEVELQHEGCRLDAAGALYVSLTEYKEQAPVTPLPLSIDTPGDKRNIPVESRFENALKRERPEVTEGEKRSKLSVNARRT